MANRIQLRIILTAYDRATRVLNRAFDSIKSSFAAVGKLAVAAVAALGGLGAAFISAINSSREFEAQLSRNRSILTGTPESIDAAMEAVTAAAEKMGAETQFTATQAAAGLEVLQRAGLTAEQAIAALPTVLNTAIGASSDLATASDQLLGVLANMGVAVSDIGRAADALTLAGAKANTNFAELAAGINVGGAAALAFGNDLETATAFLAKLADGALKGAEGGTALRNLFNELSNDLSTASKVLRQAGVDTSNLGEVLEFLATDTDKASQAYFSFTAEARRAIDIIRSQGGIDAVAELAAVLRGAEGAAKGAADVMGANLNGALASLGSAWDALQRSIAGSRVLDVLTEQVKGLSDSLLSLVQSGQMDRLQTVIVEGFREMGQATRDFFAEFRPEEIATRAANALTAVKDALAGIGKTGRAIAATLSLVFNGMQATIRTVSASVLGVLATLNENIAGVLWGMEQANLASAEAVQRFALRAENLRQTQKDLARDAEQDAADIKAAWADLLSAFEDGPESIRKTHDAVDQFAEAAELAFAAKVKPAVEGAVNQVVILTEVTNEAADGAFNLGKEFENAGLQTQASLDAAAVQAEILFDRTRESGAAMEDVVRAAENLVAAQKAAGKDADLLAQSYISLSDNADTAAESARASTRAVKGQGEALDELSDKGDDFAEKAEAHAAGFGGFVQGVINGIAELSSKALAIFEGVDNRLGRVSDRIAEAQFRLDRSVTILQTNLFRLTSGGGKGLLDGFNDWVLTINRLHVEFNTAALRVAKFEDALLKALQGGTLQMGLLNRATKAATSALSIMDGSQLEPLRRMIRQIRGDVEDLRNDVLQGGKDITIELAKARGDDASVRRLELEREEQERLLKLEEQRREARRLDQRDLVRELDDQIDKTKELIALKERQIQEDERETRTRTTTTDITPAVQPPAETRVYFLPMAEKELQNAVLNDRGIRITREKLARAQELRN